MFTQFSYAKLLAWADQQPPQNNTTAVQKIIHALCRIVLITIAEFKKNELSLRASALTFTVILSLVPMLAMSTAVVKGLGGGNQLKEMAYTYVATLDGSEQQTIDNKKETSAEAASQNPSSNLTQHLYSAIDQLFDYVERINFATLGTFGIAGIFLSVILVLGNIELAMNAIWHVATGRSAMRKVADYLTLLILMPLSLSLGVASGAILESEALLSWFSIFLPFPWMQALFLKLIPVFFLALTLYVIYLFFPNTRVKTVPALIGALFAGFFWFQVQDIYIAMQIGVARYNAIYGSFATLPLFLVWIYFGWIFILAGAQLAYAFQHRDSFKLTRSESAPSMRLAIAFDILEYTYDCFDEEQQATIDGFADKFPMHDLRVVLETLKQLKKQELLHLTDESLYLKPSLPKERLDYKKVIQTIVGAEYSETEGGKRSNLVLNAVDAPITLTAEKIEQKE